MIQTRQSFNLVHKIVASKSHLAKRTYRTWILQFKVSDISFRVLYSQTLICNLQMVAISSTTQFKKKISSTTDAKQTKMDVPNNSTVAPSIYFSHNRSRGFPQ